ncbi:hypothetical protein P43SY_001103 [Pythium insidiosum]|uniref:Uncharacterized protein n=1 Tax=Pythium insidiosum TaxID=114742 RepID=A0AAD5M918_PYTIN|nr:hypothetical protein P43SY_001103 [Pythium insidiosum]
MALLSITSPTIHIRHASTISNRNGLALTILQALPMTQWSVRTQSYSGSKNSDGDNKSTRKRWPNKSVFDKSSKRTTKSNAIQGTRPIIITHTLRLFQLPRDEDFLMDLETTTVIGVAPTLLADGETLMRWGRTFPRHLKRHGQLSLRPLQGTSILLVDTTCPIQFNTNLLRTLLPTGTTNSPSTLPHLSSTCNHTLFLAPVLVLSQSIELEQISTTVVELTHGMRSGVSNSNN